MNDAKLRHPSNAKFREGMAYERERIIKLLEERTGYGDSEWDADVLAIIALIKGEQK